MTIAMEAVGDSSQISRDDILTHLTNNEEIIFKIQHKSDADLSKEEKFQIAADIFERSKVIFLTRFGKYLNENQLNYFKNFDDEDMNVILRDLLKEHSEKARHLLIRNRRYEALNQLKEETTYFSEIEMMKRNPLLYEQLVGQYLTKDEKKERDKVNTKEGSFVKILMEGIERDASEEKRKQQEEEEDNVMEEEDDDEDEDVVPENESDDEELRRSYVAWGEIQEDRPKVKKIHNVPLITATERRLLREEFVTTMYENFLEGKDSDFDYKNVDTNQQYDNIEMLASDAEEKYFESESPGDVEMEETVKEESEDELDTYMKHIHHKLEMSQIQSNLKKL